MSNSLKITRVVGLYRLFRIRYSLFISIEVQVIVGFGHTRKPSWNTESPGYLQMLGR